MSDERKDDTQKSDESRLHASETERLESLRERLYARGGQEGTGFTRHNLGGASPMLQAEVVPVAQHTVQAQQPIAMPISHARRSFRFKLALLGILFFIGALLVSGAFLFLGQSAISGSNIVIDVTGPLTIGGGESLNMQIAVSNMNTLPIESATLIINYPRGSQSVTEPGKELFTERLQLNNIDPNEVINVPIRFLVFGEENDTKTFTVSVEYRVEGSNAIFNKDALPFEFKVSTSPVVVNVNAVKTIPSGQETTVELVVQSNSPEDLTDLLIKANYPQGFDLVETTPETASGEDTWKITSLKPGEEKKITVKGVMNGKEGDMHRFDFTVGVANARDALSIASVLTTQYTEMKIERPFLDVVVEVNGEEGETVVIGPDDTARVTITFKNALDAAIYDGVILAELGGSALDELTVDVSNGTYNSAENRIAWDSVDNESLRELTPGESHVVTFAVEPRTDIKTNPEITMTVTIQGNRVSEERVPEQVVGTIDRVIKVSSVTKLTSATIYSDGPFTNSGPIPPIAERTTEYAFLLSVKNGTNPFSGGEVTAVLPSYVTWLDRVSDGDEVTYNPANRTLKWTIGDLKANAYEEAWVQVAFTPSLSQVDQLPTLLETQRLRATDRFTGEAIRAEMRALTTSLADDPQGSSNDGRVKEN